MHNLTHTFSLTVVPAPTFKKYSYDTAYGDDHLTVTASYGGANFYTATSPSRDALAHIANALGMLPVIAPGVDDARAAWDALTEDQRAELQNA